MYLIGLDIEHCACISKDFDHQRVLFAHDSRRQVPVGRVVPSKRHMLFDADLV